MQEYQRSIYWNKITNRDTVKYLIETYDELYAMFKEGKDLRDKQRLNMKLEIKATEMLNRIISAIAVQYEEIKQLSQQSRQRYIRLIVKQISRTPNIETVRLQFIQGDYLNQIKRAISMVRNPTAKSLVMESNQLSRVEDPYVKIHSKPLLKLFVNMLNLFSEQLVFVLSERHNSGYQSFQQNTVIVEYCPQSKFGIKDHVCMAFAIKQSPMAVRSKVEDSVNKDLVREYYVYRTSTSPTPNLGFSGGYGNAKLEQCCRNKANEVWLYEQDKEKEGHHVNKFMFALYLVYSKDLFDTWGKPKSSLSNHPKWQWFQSNLNVALCCLVEGNAFAALNHLTQPQHITHSPLPQLGRGIRSSK